MMTFIDFINDSHIYVFLDFFFQPFDDFEACFYAAVGEFTELNMTAMPTKQTCSGYLKDKLEHKSCIAFIFSVKHLYLLFDYWHVLII